MLLFYHHDITRQRHLRCKILLQLLMSLKFRNLSTNKTVKEGAISQPTLLTEIVSWKEVQLDSLSESYPERALHHVSDKDTLYEVRFHFQYFDLSCHLNQSQL